MRSRLIVLVAALALAAVAIPAAANGGSLNTYEVTITNLAATQPISPPVVVTHDNSVSFWNLGNDASDGIVAIAENGDPVVAFDALDGAPGVTDVVNVGQPLTPAGTVFGDFTDTVVITIDGYAGDRISLAGMLICSNDGFAGIASVRLPRGDRTVTAGAYDAGSEINTERSADIVDACTDLGPVALDGDPNGNENDSVDADGAITRHRGIVGESDLLEAHNWGRNVLSVTIAVVEAG